MLLAAEVALGTICGVTALLLFDSQLRLVVTGRLRNSSMLRPIFGEIAVK